MNETRKLLEELEVTMQHARTFIGSREKMNPTGIRLYEEALKRLNDFLATAGGTEREDEEKPALRMRIAIENGIFYPVFVEIASEDNHLTLRQQSNGADERYIKFEDMRKEGPELISAIKTMLGEVHGGEGASMIE